MPSGPAKISRRAPKALPVQIFQPPANTVPMNCTGFTASVEESSLPFVLSIIPVDLALGKWKFVAPTEAQAAQLEMGKAYTLAVVIRNAGSEPVEDFELTVLAE